MLYKKNILICTALCFGLGYILYSCNSMRTCWGSWCRASDKGLVVINVLDKQLYDDCHIAGSVHVSFDKIVEYAQQFDAEKIELVFYCSNYFCTTSGYACKLLKERGFKHVWAYEGGIAEWYQKGLPVQGPCKQDYLSKKVIPLLADETQDTITAEQLLMKMKEFEKAA